METSDKKTIIKTAIVCGLVLLFTLPKHSGFMLGLVLLVLIPYTIISLYFVLIKKKEIKQRLIQMCLWLITCSVVIMHHIYLHQTTREFAQEVAEKVISYKSINGDYPKNIEEIGLSQKDIKPYC